MDLNNAWEQLCALRDMTRRTDTLHEAQVLQLKLYPRLLFQSSTASSFALDFPTKTIEFSVTNGPAVVLRKGDTVIKAKDAPPALDDYTKKLLGDEWEVVIKVRRKGRGPVTHTFPRKTALKQREETRPS